MYIDHSVGTTEVRRLWTVTGDLYRQKMMLVEVECLRRTAWSLLSFPKLFGVELKLFVGGTPNPHKRLLEVYHDREVELMEGEEADVDPVVGATGGAI